MGLYTKRSSQVLLVFYFGVVMIFALGGFFYGFGVASSLAVIGITFGLLILDVVGLNLLRFCVAWSEERTNKLFETELKQEEEELESRLNSAAELASQSKLAAAETSVDDFDDITDQEALDVKKDSLSSTAPTSLPHALLIFLLSEEFPTILLTFAFQMCYNYMCLVEYKDSFGIVDQNDVPTREYESRRK